MSEVQSQPKNQPILQYDKRNNQLWFPYMGTANAPHPLTLSSVGGQYAYVFSARYPMCVLGTREFKGMYPDGLATKEAQEIYKKGKKVDEDIHNLALLEPIKNIFKIPPYIHQLDTVERMLHYERLAILLEQGLGKTYITLMALMAFRELGIPHKALIICPNIVFLGWLKEVGKFSDLKVLPYKGNPEQRKECREAIANSDWDLVVTTFDMLIDRVQTNSFVYAEAWESLGPSKTVFIDKWFKERLINDAEHFMLLNGKTTKKYKADVAKILKRIPSYKLPFGKFNQARNENSNYNFFKNLPYDVLVVDEASRCIDHKSKRSGIVEVLSARAKRSYLLSGTLCVGRPTDMFMPMKILSRDIVTNSWPEFVRRYCVVDSRNKHIIRKYKNLDELKKYVQPHIISRTREQCLDLPERVMIKRYYEPTDEMVELYNEIASNNTKHIFVNKNYVDLSLPIVKISKAMQLLSGFMYYNDNPYHKECDYCPDKVPCMKNHAMSGKLTCVKHKGDKPDDKYDKKVFQLKHNPKIEMLKEDLQDTGEKTIIWAWYQEDIQNIKNLLDSEGIKYVCASDKDCVRAFEENPDVRVFLGQTVQGIGITLNSATCTIYYSHGFALEPRLQSMDRNYRIGQRNRVIVKDYIAPDTIEELVLMLLEHKTDVMQFLQEKISCLSCVNFFECQKNKIGFLKEGCVHFGNRSNAEKKFNLRLWEIGYRDEEGYSFCERFSQYLASLDDE